MSTTPSCSAQSRCHSSITDSDVTGLAPAWITRFIASAWPDSLSNGRQIGLRPFRIDDELERVETLMPDPEPVEGLPPGLREPTARRVVQQAQVRDLERQDVRALLQQSLRAADEGPLLAAGEEIQRCRPLRGRHDLDSLAIRLPVAGSLMDHSLDEVVPDDEEGHHRNGMGTERRGQPVLLYQLGERSTVTDPLQGPVMYLAQRGLEGRQGLDREEIGQRRMPVLTDAGIVAIDAGTTEATARAALDALRRRVSTPVSHVILTHAHWDHVGGLAALRAPNTRVIAQAGFADELRIVNDTGVPFRYFFGGEPKPMSAKS
jgi:Metallo-beta-lactamase superfamily